jgi:alpha-mannosidase
LSAWREAWADQSDAIVVDIINSSGEMPSTGSFVDCDNHGFLITGVKQAADASNDLIVRGYNVTSTRQKVTLLLAVPIQEVICTGLNEQSPIEKKVKVKHQRNVTFEADPLEIVTLRFVL